MGQYFLNVYSYIQIALNLLLLNFERNNKIYLRFPYLDKAFDAEIGDGKYIKKQSLSSIIVILYIYASIAFSQTYFMNIVNIIVYIPVFIMFAKIGDDQEKEGDVFGVERAINNIQKNIYYVAIIVNLMIISILQIIDLTDEKETFIGSFKNSFKSVRFDINKIKSQAKERIEKFQKQNQ